MQTFFSVQQYFGSRCCDVTNEWKTSYRIQNTILGECMRHVDAIAIAIHLKHIELSCFWHAAKWNCYLFRQTSSNIQVASIVWTIKNGEKKNMKVYDALHRVCWIANIVVVKIYINMMFFFLSRQVASILHLFEAFIRCINHVQDTLSFSLLIFRFCHFILFNFENRFLFFSSF